MFEDFKNISNNEAYKKAFNDRMLLPDPVCPGEFLGNTQRRDFIPHLRALVRELPPQASIFDVGAGAGEVLDLLGEDLQDVKINLEEPNPLLLEKYVARIARRPELSLGVTYQGYLQDYYTPGKSAPLPSEPQHLVLGVHMIYHLTAFKAELPIDPKKDLVSAISFLFERLAPGGKIFLVYADQEFSTTGQAAKYYYSQNPSGSKMLENLKAIWAARRELLKDQGIQSVLEQRFPKDKVIVNALSTPSCIFGKTIEDIAVMCITGELGESDESSFDDKKLLTCLEFVNLQGDRIGLTQENSDPRRLGMWRSNQPQVVVTIERS